MKLHRNETADGACRYIAIDTRKLKGLYPRTPEELAAAICMSPEAVILGEKFDEKEFFLIMLKDTNAEAALLGYSNQAKFTDQELSEQVYELSQRSGPHHPLCKIPD